MEDVWIQTKSGVKFSLTKPKPEMVLLEDIAHGLSNICRFNGQCKEFYSVARHSLEVAQNVPTGLEIYGLLHDAAEAYIGDMSSPLKSLFPEFKKIEIRILNTIFEAFSIPYPNPEESKAVKEVDVQMLVTEGWELFDYVPFVDCCDRAGISRPKGNLKFGVSGSGFYKDRFKKEVTNELRKIHGCS